MKKNLDLIIGNEPNINYDYYINLVEELAELCRNNEDINSEKVISSLFYQGMQSCKTLKFISYNEHKKIPFILKIASISSTLKNINFYKTNLKNIGTEIAKTICSLPSIAKVSIGSDCSLSKPEASEMLKIFQEHNDNIKNNKHVCSSKWALFSYATTTQEDKAFHLPKEVVCEILGAYYATCACDYSFNDITFSSLYI